MRLLQRVRSTICQTKKPPQKFVAHRLGRRRLLPGQATFRHLRRDRSSHARTVSRWYARDGDVVSLNQAAITRVIPPAPEQALVVDARFLPQSGKKTSGLDHGWNGRQSRTANGLDISALAWLDMAAHGADCLSVEQTPPTDQRTDSPTTRIDGSLDPLTRVVSEQHRRPLRSVITDGSYRTPHCLDGVRVLGLEPIGKRRIDAHRRDLSQGPQHSGPGRPQPYDGQGPGDNRSRVEKAETDDDALVLSHPVLPHVQGQCNLRVVRVVDTQHHRHAVLFRTDVALVALTIDRADQARFPREFLFRDANQFTGVADCQARSQATLHGHCQARLTAVTLAKREARPHHREAASEFSMARLTRRAFNQPLSARIAQHVAKGHRVETSSPENEERCT